MMKPLHQSTRRLKPHPTYKNAQRLYTQPISHIYNQKSAMAPNIAECTHLCRIGHSVMCSFFFASDQDELA